MISHRSEILNATWKMIRFKEYNFQNITSTFTYAFDVKLHWQFWVNSNQNLKETSSAFDSMAWYGRSKNDSY